MTARRDDDGGQDVSSFALSRHHRATFAEIVAILEKTLCPRQSVAACQSATLRLPHVRHVSLTAAQPAPQLRDQILKLK